MEDEQDNDPELIRERQAEFTRPLQAPIVLIKEVIREDALEKRE